jgi:hypothetical protein
MCARWVLRSLTEEHKEQREIICSELLARYEAEGDDFLTTMVMGDKIWIHHFEPETKRQSMEWHHTASPRKKKFKAITSASKIMATVFRDCEGVILIDVFPRGQRINYVETVNKLKPFRRVRPHKDVTEVLLHHDNASVYCPASSTSQPGSGFFRLPSFQSFERCNPRKEV